MELENDVSELQQQLDHEKAQTIKLQELCEEAEQQRMEMEANHKDSHTENVLIEEQLKSPEEQTTGRVLDHMANVGDGRDDPETTTTAPSFRVTQTIDYEDVRLQWEGTFNSWLNVRFSVSYVTHLPIFSHKIRARSHGAVSTNSATRAGRSGQ